MPDLDPIDLLAALTDHVGPWGPNATGLQWADARAILAEHGPRRHWLSRSKGYSKSRDVAAMSIVALLTRFPLNSAESGYIAARDTEQATLVRQSIEAFVHGTPELHGEIEISGRRVFAPRRQAELHILSADKEGAHGLRPFWLLLDELCNWPATASHEEFAMNLLAGLAKTGGVGVVMSTASTPSHWAHRLFRAAHTDPMWRVSDVHGPAPWIDPQEVASQKRMLTESKFRRLWLNEWTEADDALVTTADLEAAAVLDGPVPPVRGRRYVTTLDAGLTHDRTVVVTAHWDEKGSRTVVDQLLRWQGTKSNPVDMEEVERAITELHARYGGTIKIDPAKAEQLLLRLRRAGLPVAPYTFTATSVGVLAGALVRALRERQLWLPKDQVLLDELAAVRIVENSAGVPRLTHDSSGHDDHAVALALAVHELVDRHPGSSIVFPDDTAVAPDGQPLQQLLGPYAMSPSDTFASHLEQFGDGY